MSKLRKLARGRDCTVQILGVCNYDPETVVLAHLNGGGMGMKRHDLHGAWCCSACHDEIDGRTSVTGMARSHLRLYHLDGVIRTQEQLIKEGAI